MKLSSNLNCDPCLAGLAALSATLAGAIIKCLFYCWQIFKLGLFYFSLFAFVDWLLLFRKGGNYVNVCQRGARDRESEDVKLRSEPKKQPQVGKKLILGIF